MTAKIDTSGTFDQMLRDAFSDDPPEYVLEARAKRAELERTGKRVPVAAHNDNTELECRNVGPATLVEDLIHHDCCYLCNDQGEAAVRVMMTESEAAEIIAVLDAVGEEHPAALVGEGLREVHAGNVTWTSRGWTVVVFNDCGDWDYIDHVIAPDGRRWEFEEMVDGVKFWHPKRTAGWPSLPEDQCRQPPRRPAP